jgi:hypothetical protein
MSIDDFADELEIAARSALAETGAITGCPLHGDVTIRIGDGEAERHAYALATVRLKRQRIEWQREELMDAIQHSLEMAADGECPECARLRDA